MKTSRFSDAQITVILKRAEDGIPVAQLCREHGMSGECPVFRVLMIWSMLSKKSKDYDDFERTAGRVTEGLQAT